MNVLGIIIVVLICVVLAIALFFEIKGLIKSINQYKLKKREKQSKDDKESK